MLCKEQVRGEVQLEIVCKKLSYSSLQTFPNLNYWSKQKNLGTIIIVQNVYLCVIEYNIRHLLDLVNPHN